MAQSYTYTQNGQQYTATPMAGTTAPPVAPAGSGVTYTPANQQTLYKTAGGQYSTDPSVLTGNYSVVNQPIPTSAMNTQPVPLPQTPIPTNIGNVVGSNNQGMTNLMSASGYTLDANGQWLYTPPKAETAESIEKSRLDKFMAVNGMRADNKPPSSTDIYNSLPEKAAREAAQRDVQGYTSQINSIVSQAQADSLSVTGQGRGIPEVIIGGQQAQINKEAAIKALPLQALLANAQGNLALATEHLDTMFKLKMADANAQYEYKNKFIDSLYEFADKADQRRLDAVKLKDANENARLKDLTDFTQSLALQALKDGNTSAFRDLTSLSLSNPSDVSAYRKQVEKIVPTLSTGTGTMSTAIVPYIQTNASGKAYINYDQLTTAEKKQYGLAFRQAGLPLLKTADVAKLNAIDDARDNLSNIEAGVSTFLPEDALGRIVDFSGNGHTAIGNKISSFFQTNDDISSFNAWRTAIINNVQALAGGAGSGLRINQAEINAAMNNDLPKITDTLGTADGKIAKLRSQLSSWENILTKGSYNDAPSTTQAIPKGTDGASYGFPGYVSDGTQWIPK